MAIKVVRNYPTENWYTPAGQEEEEKVTRFEFKTMSKLDIQKVEAKKTSLASDGSQLFLNNPVVNYEVFRQFVTNWENLIDEDGNDVKYKKDKNNLVDTELMNMIPTEIINEVAWTIQEVSTFPDKAKDLLGKQ